MLKIRRPLGRLIFNMGIAIPGKTVFLIETAPWIFGLFLDMVSTFYPKWFVYVCPLLPNKSKTIIAISPQAGEYCYDFTADGDCDPYGRWLYPPWILSSGKWGFWHIPLQLRPSRVYDRQNVKVDCLNFEHYISQTSNNLWYDNNAVES